MTFDFLQLSKKYSHSQRGAISVEGAFLSGIFIIIIGASIEASFAFWQWNTAQQSARVGARIAATSDPVANGLTSMTGLSNGTESGDPMPDYTITCEGQSSSCSSGSFNAAEMNRIIFGTDNDGACGATDTARRGMCDMMSNVDASKVAVTYTNSGFGTAGNPANISPVITLTLSDIPINFAFLDIIAPNLSNTIPEIKVTVMSEDLKTRT